MADVASKQQTTALFLSTIVTRTRRHTELKKKLTNLMGNLCCAREHSVQFFAVFLHSLTAQFNIDCMGPFTDGYGIKRRVTSRLVSVETTFVTDMINCIG